LTRLGYPVVTIANPLRGLTADADYARARLQTISGPIVLVGHSYGGAVITNAARGVPNVKALAYVAAFSLAEGESLGTALPPDEFRGSHIGPSELDVVPIGTVVDLYIKPQYFQDIFAGDVFSQNAVFHATAQRPLASTAFVEPSGPPAWAQIQSWALVSLDDHAIPRWGNSSSPTARPHRARALGARRHDFASGCRREDRPRGSAFRPRSLISCLVAAGPGVQRFARAPRGRAPDWCSHDPSGPSRLRPPRSAAPMCGRPTSGHRPRRRQAA
jgi:pimeloyl-ACP methyl ester carboxylesterase